MIFSTKGVGVYIFLEPLAKSNINVYVGLGFL
jgi:hypothetical protein